MFQGAAMIPELHKTWVALGIAILVCGADGSRAYAQNAGQPPAPQQSAPVLIGYAGEMQYSGQFREEPRFNLNGSNLNFQLGQAEPVNGRISIRLWLGKDGQPRLQMGRCVSVLVPVSADANFERGGAFRADQALAGTAPNCGLSQGEVIEQWTNTLTPNAEGITYTYTSVNRLSQPRRGKANVRGEVLLKPVYTQPPRVMAATGAVAGAPQPSGSNIAEWVRYAGIERALDAILQVDSRNWLLNRYDKGSVTNGRILQRSANGLSDVLQGDYQYNGGSRGWIKVQLQNGELKCMEFWDARGTCRPPGSLSVGSQFAVGALVGAITAPRDNSTGDDGLTDKQRALKDNDEWLSRQAGCRQWSC
jgi:hypothetical protein